MNGESYNGCGAAPRGRRLRQAGSSPPLAHICTGSILQAKFQHVSKADDAHFRAFAPCGGCFSAARVSGRSNHPSLSLRRLRFRLFAYWPPVGRAVRRTTQSRCARSTAAAASHGRLGTASPPCPEPRAVPSPLRSESHATCDATHRQCALPTERCAPPTARPPVARQQSREACSCPCHSTPFQARDVRHSSPNSRA